MRIAVVVSVASAWVLSACSALPPLSALPVPNVFSVPPSPWVGPPVAGTAQVVTPAQAPTTVGSAAPKMGVFNASMMFLAEQLDRNVAADLRQRPTVVTNIVTLNALNETSALGRLISEHVMHELQVRSWAVMDIRLAKEIMITENGEFTLSRDAKKLRDNMPALNVITGTYTATSDGVLVSVRAVDLSSGRVLSTAQTRLARDKFTLGLLEKPQPIPAAALAR